jgi:hypothetical protein
MGDSFRATEIERMWVMVVIWARSSVCSDAERMLACYNPYIIIGLMAWEVECTDQFEVWFEELDGP